MLYRPSRTPPVNLDTGDERKKERKKWSSGKNNAPLRRRWLKDKSILCHAFVCCQTKGEKEQRRRRFSNQEEEEEPFKENFSEEKNWSYSTHNTKKQETEQKCNSRGRNTELEAQAKRQTKPNFATTAKEKQGSKPLGKANRNKPKKKSRKESELVIENGYAAAKDGG